MPATAAVERSLRLRLLLSSRSGRAPTLLALVAALAASLFAFAHVVEDYVTNDPLVDWDVRFAFWLHEHTSDGLLTVFKVATYAGSSLVLFPLVFVLTVVLVRRGRANQAALLVLALGGAALVNGLMKLVFERPRPEVASIHLETYSFPSGHAAAATATYATLAFLIGQRSSRRRALAAGAVAVVVIATVGFSRLYLGVHYLSDVLAGTSFGVSWACACLIAYTLHGDRPLRVRQPS